MGYYVDCIQLGSEITHGAGIGAALTGSACETIGRCHASEAVEHVSAGAALRDASRLAEIDESQASPAQTLQEEEWTSYSLATEFFRDRNWRSAYVQLEVAGTSTVTPVDLVVARLKTYLVVPETAIEDTVGQINFEMKLSRLSYPAALKVRRPRPPKICDGSDGTEYWRWLADTLRSRNVTFALDRLLETQLALRAYKLEHGAYPVTLAALAPRYLPRIPLDPFSDERQLKYRLFGKSYLLYSIGPDAKDDGGTPIDDPSSKYRRHRVLESVIGKSSTYQTGDIVAGVNR